MDASAKVFAERGYHATSTTELCEANGIGKGALYYLPTLVRGSSSIRCQSRGRAAAARF